MFGEVIQKLRKSYGLSQVDLAGKLGVTKQAVSNWENNNILPSIDMLIRIAQYFSVSCDYLLEMDHRHFIDASELTIEEVSHIQQIVNDISKAREKRFIPG